MGYLYEIATTAPAFLSPAHYAAHPPARAGDGKPTVINFGADRQQHCTLWEPAEVTHELPVLYFHGGAYVFGEAESMSDAADVYNAQGYRFCSIGFREAPWHKFPRMVNDAFNGAKAAIEHMESVGIPCDRVVVGGTSAGGHLAALVCYARWLQEAFDFPVERIAGCISVAGVADAADLLIKPFPTHAIWKTQVDLITKGQTRADMRAAVARYSPVDLVENALASGASAANVSSAPCAPSASDNSSVSDNSSASDNSSVSGVSNDSSAPDVSNVPDVSSVSNDSGNSSNSGASAANVSSAPCAPSASSIPRIPRIPLFVVHGRADTLSPYSSQVRFVDAMRREIGDERVEFLTLEGQRWQHMHTTVTMHKHAVEDSPTLQALFTWLEQRR